MYNGNGTGGFTDSQPFTLNYCPESLISGDLNGDAKPDLVSLNNSLPVSGAYSTADIMINQGKGAFAAPKTLPLDPNGRVLLALLDVNGDGKPDLVAASNFSNPFELTTLLNNGDGTFGNRIFTPLAIPPLTIIGADLNGDGKGDLILPPSPTAHVVTNDMAFAAGNGDGTFQTQVPLAGPNTTLLQFADFNNDGHPDLLAGSSPNAPVGYFMVILSGTPPAVTTAPLSTVNGASFTAASPVAADSIATAFGAHLAVTGNEGGTTVAVKDAAGTTRPGTIFFASAGQVNFQVPPGTANGPASVSVTASDGTVTAGTVQVANVAPGMFAANAAGLFAGSVLRVHADGTAESAERLSAGCGE